MSVGEEAGALDDLFVEVADFYEQEVDYDLKQLADAIEPILIVAMGLMVLVLAWASFFRCGTCQQPQRVTDDQPNKTITALSTSPISVT